MSSVLLNCFVPYFFSDSLLLNLGATDSIRLVISLGDSPVSTLIVFELQTKTFCT